MHSSSPKGKQTALISFLPSEWTADNEKYVKTAAEKGNQMRSKGSNEVVGRIDTSRDPIAFSPLRLPRSTKSVALVSLMVTL